MRYARLLIAAFWLPMACSQTGGGCGGGTYVYPRSQLSAQPTQQAVRARITQHGLDAAASAVPGLLQAACAGNPADATASCAVNPANSDQVLFYLATNGQPVGITSPITASIESGSSIALNTSSLDGNVDLQLVQDSNGGGIQVTLGCGAPSVLECTDASQYITGSVDMVMAVAGESIAGLGWDDSTCSLHDTNPPNPGFEIQSLRFTMRPRVTRGADGKPYLTLSSSDVTFDRMWMSLTDPTWLTDPQSTRWGSTMSKVQPPCTSSTASCTFCGMGNAVTDYVLPAFTNGPLAQTLATIIARQMLRQLAQKPLELSGAVDVRQVLPVPTPYANPTGFLVAASTQSPTVTGTTGALGWNFDFDAGFASEASACVPSVTPPSWVLPTPPDPGTTVQVPDPTTGASTAEPFDLAVMLGDKVMSRAAYELFYGGGLCLNLDAASVADLSHGFFVPNVTTLGILAPSLSSVAPDDAPVDMRVVPHFPPVFQWGTGTGQGSSRDSLVHIAWPEVEIDLYPLVDDTALRVLGFTVDIDAGLSVTPAPDGTLAFTIDHLTVSNAAQAANAWPIPFNPAGVSSLVGSLLPTLLSTTSIHLDLSSAMLGLPFVPKLLAAAPLGQNDAFLTAYVHFCTPSQITDSTNTLCYEPPPPPLASDAGPDAADAAAPFAGQQVSDAHAAANTIHVRITGATTSVAHLQLAYRVGHSGPYFSFRNAGPKGVFTLEHPAFGLPGQHQVELVARDARAPEDWSTPIPLTVDIPPTTPTTPSVQAPPASAGTNPQGGCSSTPGPASPWVLGVGLALAWMRRRRACRKQSA